MHRIVLTLTLLFPTLLFSQTREPVVNATLVTWDDPNPAGTVDEYRVYNCVTEPCNLTTAVQVATVPVGTLTWPISLPAAGENYIFVTAFNAANSLETPESNVLGLDVLTSVINLRIVRP